MKWSFLLFSSFLCLQAIAQYPATGNKMRLGWQTTGDGLVYRGAIGDTTTLDPSGLNNAWMLLDTASGNLYAYRTKAWRLVSGGGGGGGLTMPFDSVTFNVNETDASLRELKYSEEKGYLQYGGQDSVQIPILPGIWYVRNDDSVTISKGMVLRASGTLGASGRIKVKRMIADGSIDAMYILGIAMQDIAVGADGYAMSQGKIRQVNTQAYSEGAVLYADVDTLGGLTQTEPGNGFLKLPIAFVVHSASNGTIAVRITSGAYMRDLHDTYITSPDSSASLYYNKSEGIWRDTTPAALKSDISGTANYIPKFTGANTIGNSVLFDNGTNISLGSTNPISNGANSRWLTLYGSTEYSGGIVYSVADTAQAYHYLNADATGKHLRHYANSGYGQTFFTNGSGTARMTISAAGDVTIPNAAYMATNSASNVGIGTESTTYKLDLNDQRQDGGITGMRISTYYYPGILFQSALRSNNGKVILNDFANGYGTGSLQSAMILQSPGAVQFSTGGDNIRTTIDASGNVGIATSSPSRPLHVAGTTAIRIPAGTTSDRGTSANGDIRYNTTNANFEWYSGTGWREPVNAARSPAAGLANRFSKFDANGLLDTSAILIQANNRIGIFNSPAAGDSALTVTGGIRATRDVRVRRANVSEDNSQVLILHNKYPTGAAGLNVFLGSGGLKLAASGSGFTGSYNFGVGADALKDITSGNSNIGFGTRALSSCTACEANIAIGTDAMFNTTTEQYNLAIGTNTLKNTKSNGNIAIGLTSLESLNNASSGENTSIGLAALSGKTQGANDVAIGSYAGNYTTALYGSITTNSSNSVFIGAHTLSGGDSRTNQIVIGYGAVGNGSNTTTIGNSSTTHTILQYGETLLGYAASGDVGDYRVQVNGNGYVSGEFRIGYTADQGNYPLQVNGQIFATNATIATSDARLKQDIEPLKSGLKEVLSLNPVTYTFKPDTINNYPKGKQVGFLAQEIKATVQGDYAGSIVQEAGGYLGVADTKLIPLLVKAIQEQQAQIEALKKEIEALKNK